jgi:ribonucleoside-diphosphate reductase alpha chain
MQLATDHINRPSISGHEFSSALSNQDSRYSQYKIIRRNGAVAGFEPNKISIAMTKAFIAVNGGQGAASARVREVVARLTNLQAELFISRTSRIRWNSP